MGLALHNPSDSLFLDSLSERRDLRCQAEDTLRAKHQRRPLHWSRNKIVGIALRQLDNDYYYHPLVHSEAIPPGRALRKHHHAALQTEIGREAYVSPVYSDPGKPSSRLSRVWTYDAVEGRALAASNLRLPGDFDRRRRPPSLERQEAFRDGRTIKKRSFAQHAADGLAMSADDAELYRLGLLYDDEHERGEGFSLNAIVHDDPMYPCAVRQAKRGRGRKREDHQDMQFAANLPLDLSFAVLSDDDALAAFLISPAESELVAEEQCSDSAVDALQDAPKEDSQLDVIHELESELESDSESVSEPEEEEEKEEEEEESMGNAALLDNEFPDVNVLLSNAELDNDNDENMTEDEEEAWAFLDTLDAGPADKDGSDSDTADNLDVWHWVDDS